MPDNYYRGRGIVGGEVGYDVRKPAVSPAFLRKLDPGYTEPLTLQAAPQAPAKAATALATVPKPTDLAQRFAEAQGLVGTGPTVNPEIISALNAAANLSAPQQIIADNSGMERQMEANQAARGMQELKMKQALEAMKPQAASEKDYSKTRKTVNTTTGFMGSLSKALAALSGDERAEKAAGTMDEYIKGSNYQDALALAQKGIDPGKAYGTNAEQAANITDIIGKQRLSADQGGLQAAMALAQLDATGRGQELQAQTAAASQVLQADAANATNMMQHQQMQLNAAIGVAQLGLQQAQLSVQQQAYLAQLVGLGFEGEKLKQQFELGMAQVEQAQTGNQLQAEALGMEKYRTLTGDANQQKLTLAQAINLLAQANRTDKEASAILVPPSPTNQD